MHKTLRLLAGAVTVFILMYSLASATDKYLVIPVTKTGTTTCSAPDEVISAGGKCWKDRNLGALRVAISQKDASAYGDLYQWGRPRDGHQHRTSAVISSVSAYDDPEHKNFIKTQSFFSYDWRLPQNHNLWQGLGGINNPCPQGFRLPTKGELNAERESWTSNDSKGAFKSPLKLVVAGDREFDDGSLSGVDSYGYYWSSTVDGSDSHALIMISTAAAVFSVNRAFGFSVRCIKD